MKDGCMTIDELAYHEYLIMEQEKVAAEADNEFDIPTYEPDEEDFPLNDDDD